MGAGTPCWLCESNAGELLTLRPGGAADGRRVCRGCAQGLIAFLGDTLRRGGPAVLSSIFPALQAARPAPEPDDGEGGALFAASVLEALDSEGEGACAGAAIAFLGMDLWPEALQALSRLAPASALGGRLSDRALVSLFSRLLDETALAPDAREVLARSLEAGAGSLP